MTLLCHDKVCRSTSELRDEPLSSLPGSQFYSQPVDNKPTMWLQSAIGWLFSTP
nr:MAG TPA: hypothetical protein [Caudoviricetes sp.]